MPLPLAVENLKTYYPTLSGDVRAVDGVTFTLEKGVSLGIAGESGCGKSTLGYSLLRLIPPPGRIIEGRILVDGMDITRLDEDEVRRIRWKVIAMVFQGAMNSLNPVYTVRRQMVETAMIHIASLGEDEAYRMAKISLELVRLRDDVLKRYPHELSGGMKQRVVIAMALMLEPEILIADEPTTALDMVVQAQIINLLKELQRRLKMNLILITHDLSLIPELCDRIAIMYAGKIVEYGPLEDVYRKPMHPYTYLLLKSIPRLDVEAKLQYISGTPPDLRAPPSGCRFNPRCPYTSDQCGLEEPRLTDVEKSHFSTCHRAREGLW